MGKQGGGVIGTHLFCDDGDVQPGPGAHEGAEHGQRPATLFLPEPAGVIKN